MESQEVSTTARQRRKFAKEFKLETVQLVKEGTRSSSQVARDLDLTDSALRNWVRQYDIDTGDRPGTTTPEREELRRLRAEVRQLRMEREILKKHGLLCQGIAMRFQFIHVERANYPVTMMCRLLKRLS